jgi:CHAT domain-containing protein
MAGMARLACVAAAGAVAVLGMTAAASLLPSVIPLPVGLTVEGELGAGEAVQYAVALPAGGAYRVAVEQRGIDVTVAVGGAAGWRTRVDSPLDRQGTESLVLRPERAGEVRIEVRAREPGTPPSGRYEIVVQALAVGDGGAGRLGAEEALTRAGQLYLEGTAEAWRQALPFYAQAAAGFRAAGDRRAEARALYERAVVLRLVDDPRAALEAARVVLPLWTALDEGGFAAATENEGGLDQWMLGDAAAARGAFARALALAQTAGDRYGEAVAASNLCLMDLSRGDLRPGIACYDRALPLLAAVRAEELEAAALTSLGRAYDALGEPQEARGRYQDALVRFRDTRNRAGEARTLNNLGAMDGDLGEVEEALARYGEALSIFRELDDRRWQARVLHNLGLVYQGAGEPRRALASFELALPVWRQVGDRAGEAATASSLGAIHGQLGARREALAFHQQALALQRALGDRRGEGIALVQLGYTRLALADAATALPCFTAAAERLAASGDLPNQAEALRGEGEALTALGDSPAAVASLRRAIAAAREAGHSPGEARALLALARAERRAGAAGAARTDAERAVAAFEALRTRIGDPDLRASFSGLAHQAYELDIELLMEAHRAVPGAGHDREALAVAERARARTLLDLLGGAGIGLHGSFDGVKEGAARADGVAGTAGAGAGESVDPALLARRAALAVRLAAKAERAARQGAEGATLRAQRDAEQQEILRDLDLADAEIRRQSPAYADLMQPHPLDAAGIQALLDPHTLLLAYALGTARSYLWAVTREAVASFELPPRAVLEEQARRLHQLWSAANPARRPAAAAAAQALAGALLGPVADRLGDDRLVILADGALNYLPFAALPLPAPGAAGAAAVPTLAAPLPVIVRHEVVVLPSASALAAARRRFAARPRAPRELFALADPVFDRADERLGGAVAAASSRPLPSSPRPTVEAAGPAGSVAMVNASAEPPAFARLPASRAEAEAIAALAPRGEATVAVGFAAARPAVVGEALFGYRIVHFATHGVLDTDHPALSGLALSSIDEAGQPRHGFLAMRDVYDLRLSADLVVLSGCRTALGRELRGEGLVGLARGFQYAGAARVLASLWQVEDRATAALMTRFYGGLWRDGMTPAAALRAAQLSLRAERRYRDPSSWAAFVLIGDWR